MTGCSFDSASARGNNYSGRVLSHDARQAESVEMCRICWIQLFSRSSRLLGSHVRVSFWGQTGHWTVSVSQFLILRTKQSLVRFYNLTITETVIKETHAVIKEKIAVSFCVCVCVCEEYHYNAKLSLQPVEEEVMSRHHLLILFFLISNS